MDDAAFFRQLRELKPEEQAGYAYFLQTGTQVHYIKLLQNMSQEAKQALTEQLKKDYSPEAVERILHGRTETLNDETIPQFFVSRPKTIQIQQLQRYIQIPPHRHDFFELVFVLDGNCQHVIGDNAFVHQGGDFTIIPPGITHYLESEGDCVCLTAKATVETFRSLFFSILRGNPILSGYLDQSLRQPWFRCAVTLHAGEDAEYRHILLRLYDQQENERAYSADLIKSLFRVLLSYLLQNYEDTAEFLVNDAVRQKQTVEIVNFIFQNYRDITLQQAADHFHFNPSYLSTRIRQLTGQSFSELLKDYRMGLACQLLRDTELPLYEICEQVGYYNASQFVRSFRQKYAQTPIEYRKAQKSL